MDRTWDRARGNWKQILPKLGVAKRFLTGKNGPCPVCGGKDRFRFTDRSKDGDYFCNQCGAGKGIKLVMKVNGWDFKTAAYEIDKALGYRREPPVKMDKAHQAARKFFDSCPDLPPLYEPPKSTREATLWLREYHPERLQAWLDRHDPMLAIWLTREN